MRFMSKAYKSSRLKQLNKTLSNKTIRVTKKEATRFLFYCIIEIVRLLVSPVLLVSQEYMEAVMKKKKKPCPNCLRARWLVLYLACFALFALLFANQFLDKGM